MEHGTMQYLLGMEYTQQRPCRWPRDSGGRSAPVHPGDRDLASSQRAACWKQWWPLLQPAARHWSHGRGGRCSPRQVKSLSPIADQARASRPQAGHVAASHGRSGHRCLAPSRSMERRSQRSESMERRSRQRESVERSVRAMVQLRPATRWPWRVEVRAPSDRAARVRAPSGHAARVGAQPPMQSEAISGGAVGTEQVANMV